MASIAHGRLLKSPLTTSSPTSARQRCLTNHFLLQSSCHMASFSKEKNNPKFGHLPLSTSGPEECALTVYDAHHFPQTTQPDQRARVQRFSAPPTITRAAPFRPMSAKISSFTAYCRLMCRRWRCRSSGRIGSIAAVRMRWRRIRL